MNLEMKVEGGKLKCPVLEYTYKQREQSELEPRIEKDLLCRMYK